MLVVEFILRGAHHGTALPLMSSSWKNIVVNTHWDAAFERSLNMDSTAIVTLMNSHEVQ
jgi:hypothetical protein